MRAAPDASDPGEVEVVAVSLTERDAARLDQAAHRRGIDRAEMVAAAIDEFLAREMWSGGFIPPPPPMEVPRR